MGKETDSDEDEIWNYKSVAKERAQTNRQMNVQESSHGRTSVKLRRKSCQSLKKDVPQKCETKVHSSTDQLRVKEKSKSEIADGIKENDATEVIDVDLEPENEFVSSKVPVLSKEKNLCNKISQRNKSIKNKNSAHVNLGSPSHKGMIKSKLSTNKICSSTKVVRTKMVASKSSRSVKASALSTPEKCESVKCHNIHRYFSPTSEERKKKRKSSESVDSLFDFVDEELMFLREEEGSVPAMGGTISDNLLPFSNSHCHSITNTTDCLVKSGSLRENIDSSTAQENTALQVKGDVTDEWNNPTTPKKVVNGGASCSEHIDTPTASLEDEDNIVVTKSESSSDECDKIIPDTDTEGGFLADEEACSLESCVEDYKCRDKCDLQISNSSIESSGSKQSSLSSGCDVHSAAEDGFPSSKSNSSDSSISLVETIGETLNVNRHSSIAQNDFPSSADTNMLLTAAQKQTSIFSFFKAKFGSGPKTLKSLNNTLNVCSNSVYMKSLPNSFSKVAARPNLHQRSTSSVAVASMSRHSPKHLLTKSASVADIEKQYEVGKEEQQQNNTRTKRQCPFYKKIPTTNITVDAFSYGVIPGCEAYVLTHFHYDHYGGLTKRFAQPVYCSMVTANLVEQRLGVDKKWINKLPLWKPCQVAGITLTLMEANHCPGAVMVLFELKDGRKVVHTGDFRACPEMEEYPMLKGVATSDLFLDTTYCNPSYTFPTQSEVVNFVVSLVLTYVSENPKTLIVCGTYTIGKEKIFSAIAEALNSKICVTRDKKKVLDCLDDKEIKSRVTLDWSAGQVHVVPMGKLNQKALFEHHACHPQFQTVLAFEPTGWTHSGKVSLQDLGPKWSKNRVTLYGVPYSEHSSYLELKRFIQFLRPKKIIPTVNNGNPTARKKMEDTFAQWMRENLASIKTSVPKSQQTKLNTWAS